MSRYLPIVLVIVFGCGSDDGDKTPETRAETVDETTQDTAFETEQPDVIETVDTEVVDTFNSDVDDTRSEAIGDADVPADRLLEFQFGNQITGSTLTITALGVTDRTERICCPPETTAQEAADLTTSQVAGLRADIEAIAAVDATTTQALGAFPEGATVGSLVVYRGGRSYIVMAYSELGGDRVRVKSIADDARNRLLILVNGLVDQDLSE